MDTSPEGMGWSEADLESNTSLSNPHHTGIGRTFEPFIVFCVVLPLGWVESPCCMSIIRNYKLYPVEFKKGLSRPVDFKKRQCHISLRPKKGCVAVSILGCTPIPLLVPCAVKVVPSNWTPEEPSRYLEYIGLQLIKCHNNDIRDSTMIDLY